MSHPYHTGIKGQQGGSRPSVNRDHVKACSDILPKQQAEIKKKLAALKNPVNRLPEAKPYSS